MKREGKGRDWVQSNALNLLRIDVTSEPEVFSLLETCATLLAACLQAQAQAAGGRVVTLLGNHELMLIQVSAWLGAVARHLLSFSDPCILVAHGGVFRGWGGKP